MPISESVEHFLATGDIDRDFSAWDGDLEHRRQRGDAQLRSILVRIMSWRSEHAPLLPQTAPANAASLLGVHLSPMLTGLFGAQTATKLLLTLPGRFTVASVSAFSQLAQDLPLDLLWRLANILLDDLAAPPLADDLPQLNGFCEGGRAWVLPRAFSHINGPPPYRSPSPEDELSDTLVHECAHLLHELTPTDLGLGADTAPLLTVPQQAQETFAWTCELWSCLTRGSQPAAAVLGRIQQGSVRLDERVNKARLLDTLTQAVAKPDQGWAVIGRDYRRPFHPDSFRPSAHCTPR